MNNPTTKTARELAEAQLDEQILAFRDAVNGWRSGEISDGQYEQARKMYAAAMQRFSIAVSPQEVN